jgi:tetratricopeptide (TPR) repeat protein
MSMAETAYRDGLALAQSGRHAEALTRFETALSQGPVDSRVLFALGNTARALGDAGTAEHFFQLVLAQEPDRLEALVNLANLMRQTGRTGEVIALLRPALERRPEEALLWLTLGNALREAGDIANAVTFYQEALRLDPNSVESQGNLADLMADSGEIDSALALYDAALLHAPHHAQARLNRAMLHFLKGDLARAWPDYAYRLKLPGKSLTYTHGLPDWDGVWRQGLRVLVSAEQGIGDQIMFASVIPDLAAQAREAGGTLLLECEPRLVPLFRRSFLGAGVHGSCVILQGGVKRAQYEWLENSGGADAAIPMAGAVALLRRQNSDFPDPHAFLIADADERAFWRQSLSAYGEGPYLGICWRSGNVVGLRALQYAPLAEWAAFLGTTPYTPVMLQYDGREEEVGALEAMSGKKILVPRHIDQKNDIDRTAGLIAALDAVASAPTAVSWMSAALGVKTAKILYNTSWTSFGQEFEPLAPSALCIMPSASGDWPDAFARAYRALASGS